MNITKKEINSVLRENSWTVMNEILYRMCSDHKKHNNIPIIMAKICLIGRSYSASIERRKTKANKKNSDDFYEKKAAPVIKKSDIDKWLKSLERYKTINEHNLSNILETHSKVMKLFNKISGINKRSLASKYLHFHLPNLFYIYDSRATKSLRAILPRHRMANTFGNCDDEYSKFCQKLLFLQTEIKRKFNQHLNPRQLDRLLLLKA